MSNDVERVINLEPGWKSVLEMPAASFGDRAHLSLYTAKNATIQFMIGNLSAADARCWADFLLALPALHLEPRVSDVLSEFLAEWSSSSTIEIADETVDVWQSRMSHAEI